VYWTWSADDNLDMQFVLDHTDAATGTVTEIGSGIKPCALHVDFGLNGLSGDSLSGFPLLASQLRHLARVRTVLSGHPGRRLPTPSRR